MQQKQKIRRSRHCCVTQRIDTDKYVVIRVKKDHVKREEKKRAHSSLLTVIGRLPSSCVLVLLGLLALLQFLTHC